ncbi:uncharacterized protein LOC142330546 [Lycorma delicatula]|uniref:uncharacterized protein LOC142330546 n=1 Tax=Lycorma delicatula TaxID=130591 RepID=UPI003F50E37B
MFVKYTYYESIILFSCLFFFCEGRYSVPCNITSHCEATENSICKNNVCQCKIDHFLGQDFNKTLCIPCPALGEHCGTVQCCRHSSYLTCSEGLCRCRNSYDGIYCWNANSVETVQFESIAQMILGLALIFTIAVLGSLVWRLCARQEIPQQSHLNLNRDTSFASLNSVQRLVLIRLQDRPPPYHPSYQPCKYFGDLNNGIDQIQSEAPPPYTITVTNQLPIAVSSQGGLENPTFNIGEMQEFVSTTTSTVIAGSNVNISS